MFEHRDEPRRPFTPAMLWSVLVEPWWRWRERSTDASCPGCGTPVTGRARQCETCGRYLPPAPFQVEPEPVSLERVGVYLLVVLAAVLLALAYAAQLVDVARSVLPF